MLEEPWAASAQSDHPTDREVATCAIPEPVIHRTTMRSRHWLGLH